MKYWRVWLQLTKNAFSATLSNRIDSLGYFLGKLIRFYFLWILIVSLFRYTGNIAGYSKEMVLLFFLTYNIVDVSAQAFFRGIYTFKNDVKRGTFDFMLIRPINTLFYIMTKLTDLLDFLFLIPIMYHTVVTIQALQTQISFGILNIIEYILFICMSLVIILGIHIFTAAMTVKHIESDNIIWFYRECMTIGRFPPEIFSAKIQFTFTYIFPIIIAVSFPVKALLSGVQTKFFLTAFVITSLFFGGSLLFWKRNIKFYSSASS